MSLDDPQEARFANIAEEIHQSYRGGDDGEWADSPFAWIRSMPSRTVGAIGEKLVSAWCLELGLDVVRSPDSEADRLISGNRVEIKFSTRWQNGEYRFQQIRDQDYEFLFALGLSPFAVHAWLIPKEVLLEHVIGRMGQHTGAGASDTDWLAVRVGDEPDWLQPCGGDLSAASEVLLRLERPNRRLL